MMPIDTLTPVTDRLAQRGDLAAIVVFTADGSERLGCGELHARIHSLAMGFADRFEPGTTLALFAPESPRWIIAALAAIRAGCVIAPLDLQASSANLAHMLADSGACLAITTSDQMKRLDGIDIPLFLLDAPHDDPRGLDVLGKETSLPECRPDDTAILFYTSGTTGRPKGVPLTHANIAFQLNTIATTGMLGSSDRLVLPLPMHHVYPFVIGMLLPLFLGVPVILPQSLTGPQIVRALREAEASVMVGVPRLYDALYAAINARVAERGQWAVALFDRLLAASIWARRRFGVYLGRRVFGNLHAHLAPNLRLLACGGAAIDPSLAWRLEGLGWRLAIGYGLTETSPLLTMNLPPSPRLASVGRPLPGVSIRIEGDTEGEILAKGPGVFAGYHHLPDKTREAFTPDGWFRTGDLGRLDGDWLTITGRVKELIVTPGGENIQPEEVERVFSAHPFIQEFALLEWGGRLVGVAMPDPGEIRRAGMEDISIALRQAVGEVNQRLPSYQRIVDFAVTRDPLPRTRLGKLRRHELPRCYEELKSGRAQHPGPLPVERMAEADRRLLEEPLVRSVWDWLARRFPDVHLTPDTSLRLDLGVDSLGWLELSVGVQRLTGAELGEATIAEIETVRDLLKAVQHAPKVETTVSWEQPEAVLSPEDLARVQPHQGFWRIAHRSLAWINRWLMHGGYRLEVSGLENLPAGQFVLAPNHLSVLDPFAIAAVLPVDMLERTCWAGWTGIAFGNPLTRFFSRVARVLPIDPEKEVVRSLALTLAALQQGNHLVVFPEGRRSPTGSLQSLRPGLGLLMVRYPVPVVPVAIGGTFEAWPVGRKLPRLFLPVSVRFGLPLDPCPLIEQGGDAASRITDAVTKRLSVLIQAKS